MGCGPLLTLLRRTLFGNLMIVFGSPVANVGVAREKKLIRFPYCNSNFIQKFTKRYIKKSSFNRAGKYLY